MWLSVLWLYCAAGEEGFTGCFIGGVSSGRNLRDEHPLASAFPFYKLVANRESVEACYKIAC
jgi:hypothetical protein